MLLRKIRISADIIDHVNFVILQRLKHFFIILICLYVKFQCLISQTVYGISNIFRQRTGKLSSLFIHGKSRWIIVQKSDPDAAMLIQPCLFCACKTLAVIKRKIFLIQICLKKRTVVLQLAHSPVQLRLDIAAFFVYYKIYAGFSNCGNR